MTKQEELKAWQDFAESLPIESYSKGAMQSLLIELENAMRSDYLPTLSLFEAGQRASDLIQAAKEHAQCVLRLAKEESDKLSAEAKDNEKRFRARVDAWKIKAGKEIDAL